MVVKRRCVVKGCPTKNLPREEWGSLFCIPLNDELRKQWFRNLRLEDLSDFTTQQLTNRGYRVCHRHFEERQFQNYLKKKLLFNVVPPTITSVAQTPEQQQHKAKPAKGKVLLSQNEVQTSFMPIRVPLEELTSPVMNTASLSNQRSKELFYTEEIKEAPRTINGHIK